MDGETPTADSLTKLITSTGKPVQGAPLGAVLSGHALLTPDTPAFTMNSESLSFSQLDRLANRRARQLARDFGVGEGDRVAIAVPNSVQFVEATFAVWKLGATTCPVSWRMAEREFGEVIALLDPKCVVGTVDLPATRHALCDVGKAPPSELPETPLPPCFTAPGKIQNSGGSTGRPKLIVDPLPSTWGPDKEGRRLGPRVTFFNPGPLYHSAPFNYTCMSIAQGSHALCMDRFDVEGWIDTVERYRPSFVYLVPTMMRRIAKHARAQAGHSDFSSIDNLTHMAAPCPPDVKRWWIERIGCEKVLEIYGGTERIGATVIDGCEWLDHPGSVGKAAAGYEIVVCDEDGAELAVGSVGEIYFRNAAGVGSAYDYIGAQDRISGDLDSFGDMGWVDEDGYLFIADRRTDMVTVGGSNVFPAEVEAAIETLPGVLCAAVVGLPDPDMGNRLHAIVELDHGVAEPEDALKFLEPAISHFGKIKHPRSAEFTHERIRDDAGKVRRGQLRESCLSRTAG